MTLHARPGKAGWGGGVQTEPELREDHGPGQPGVRRGAAPELAVDEVGEAAHAEADWQDGDEAVGEAEQRADRGCAGRR